MNGEIKTYSVLPGVALEKFHGGCAVDPFTKKTLLEGDLGSRHIRFEIEGGPGAIFKAQEWVQFLRCLANAMERC